MQKNRLFERILCRPASILIVFYLSMGQWISLIPKVIIPTVHNIRKTMITIAAITKRILRQPLSFALSSSMLVTVYLPFWGLETASPLPFYVPEACRQFLAVLAVVRHALAAQPVTGAILICTRAIDIVMWTMIHGCIDLSCLSYWLSACKITTFFRYMQIYLL